jgi:alcohol dehydrogenase (NADP+)
MTTKAYATASASSPLAPFLLTRREPLPTDVDIEILYCGVCHSDLHQARNEWGEFAPTAYPCVPGHEIVGSLPQSAPHGQRGDVPRSIIRVSPCATPPPVASLAAGREIRCARIRPSRKPVDTPQTCKRRRGPW